MKDDLQKHFDEHSAKIKTTQDKFEDMLYQCGIFEKDAHAIMEYAKLKLDAIDNYRMTWDRPANEYPDAVYTVMFIILKPIVVEWAEKNMPQAFWIPAFKN